MLNVYLTRWRRWGSRVRLGDVPEAGAEDAALARRVEWDALRLALAQLPAGQRVVLVLRYVEDLPDPSIAALLGCRASTVRSRAARGLAALRPLMAAGTTGTTGRGRARPLILVLSRPPRSALIPCEWAPGLRSAQPIACDATAGSALDAVTTSWTMSALRKTAAGSHGDG